MALRKKTRLTRRQVENLIHDLPMILSGSKPDRYNLRSLMNGAIAHFMFTKINEAYLEKSTGGTDEFGNKWAPLSINTKRRRVKTGRGRRRGNLTRKQDETWSKMYSRTMRHLLQKGMIQSDAQGLSAAMAWNLVKAQGAITKTDIAETLDTPIMIDTGRLSRSLAPGNFTKAGGYRPKNNDQLSNIRGSKIEIGTKVPYSEEAESGPKKPTRDIIPSQWESWIDEAIDIGIERVQQRLYEIL